MIDAIPVLSVVLVLSVVILVATLEGGQKYAGAAVLCWFLALLAWYQGRVAYTRYQRRQTDFILGRLIMTTFEAEETEAAKSLEEVAEQTVANLKALLEEVKKQRDLVKKEIFAKLKEWLDEQTHGPES